MFKNPDLALNLIVSYVLSSRCISQNKDAMISSCITKTSCSITRPINHVAIEGHGTAGPALRTSSTAQRGLAAPLWSLWMSLAASSDKSSLLDGCVRPKERAFETAPASHLCVSPVECALAAAATGDD